MAGVSHLHRPRVPREEDFGSPLRGARTASRVGLWLGGSFLLAFLTGLYSHLAQLPDPPTVLPTGPAWLYRVTQGTHVAAGTAAVPLLLVKLWSVYPRLFARVPLRHPRRLLLHLLEKGSIALLVGAAIFQLATGLANSAQWYPWGFTFRLTHFAVAWIAVGAMLVHVAVKLPVIRTSLQGADGPSDVDPSEVDPSDRRASDPGPARDGAARSEPDRAVTRRSLLGLTWVAAGLAVVTTAGAAVPPLRRVSVFAVRSGDGPGGVPVNRSASAAGVVGRADDPAYRLVITSAGRRRDLSMADLAAMPQVTATLPIACVEGWSASGRWTGVRVRDLVALVGGSPGTGVVVRSLQSRGAYAVSHLPGRFADHPDTLLALHLDGAPLSLDHGYPCRLIAPNRPGVLQTKWVSRLEVDG